MTSPCSPSTQATSFLTVDSDEKSYNGDSHENGRPVSSGLPPATVDVDRGGRVMPPPPSAPFGLGVMPPDDGDGGGGGGAPGKLGGVMTTTVLGGAGAGGGELWSGNGNGRAVSKRPSRFRLDFWKKRSNNSNNHNKAGPVQDASP